MDMLDQISEMNLMDHPRSNSPQKKTESSEKRFNPAKGPQSILSAGFDGRRSDLSMSKSPNKKVRMRPDAI